MDIASQIAENNLDTFEQQRLTRTLAIHFKKLGLVRPSITPTFQELKTHSVVRPLVLALETPPKLIDPPLRTQHQSRFKTALKNRKQEHPTSTTGNSNLTAEESESSDRGHGGNAVIGCGVDSGSGTGGYEWNREGWVSYYSNFIKNDMGMINLDHSCCFSTNIGTEDVKYSREDIFELSSSHEVCLLFA